MRQGLAAYQATGAEMGRPAHLALLAEACEKVGHSEEGLAVVAEALAIVDRTGERSYEAELYRLKGELILKAGPRSPSANSRKSSGSKVHGRGHGTRSTAESAVHDPQSEADYCFRKAIEVAQHQQATALELRAVVSLTRLTRSHNQRGATRHKLAEVYNRFSEGFDIADLQEAKALLDELGN
jgi:predicted ATPase